jgi:hypothetical protein
VSWPFFVAILAATIALSAVWGSIVALFVRQFPPSDDG